MTLGVNPAPPLPTKVDNKTDGGAKDRPRTTPQQQHTVIYKDKLPQQGSIVKLNDVMKGKDPFNVLGEPALLFAWRGSLVRRIGSESCGAMVLLADFTIVIISDLPDDV